MFLQYGNISLKVIDITRFERTTVWTPDGTDILGIDVILGVTATYAPGGNPALTSLIALQASTVAEMTGRTSAGGIATLISGSGAGVGGGPVVAGPGAGAPGGGGGGRLSTTTIPTPTDPNRGNNPSLTRPLLETDLPVDQTPVSPIFQHTGPETDVELRAQLWIPRQSLTLVAFLRQSGQPFLWLQSPRPGFLIDLNNGPKPLSVDVVSASGEPNSVVVHFQVQTRISPCPIGSDRLVLSHRWQMSHTHDAHNYLTRIVRGQIVFNPAVALAQGVNPDFIRAQFIHPVPLGFERKVPEVTESSDGTTIEYTITDTDPTIIFDAGNSGATEIQIVEKVLQDVGTGVPSNATPLVLAPPIRPRTLRGR